MSSSEKRNRRPNSVQSGERKMTTQSNIVNNIVGYSPKTKYKSKFVNIASI